MKLRAATTWLAGLVVAAGSLTFTATPVSAASDVQVVLHGSGCGEPLEASALSTQGKSLGNRTLVKGKRDIAMEAYASSQDGKRFVFSTYNCKTETSALYVQPLTKRPKAKRILSLQAGWWLLDATWDIARGGPAVLYRDPNYTYFLKVYTGGTWTTIWTGTRDAVGGYFLEGIEGQSGREYLLFGDNFNSWQIWRVSGEGYIWTELSGPGEIGNVTSDAFGSVNAITGRDGSWVCDGFADGKIADALVKGECATIPGGGAYGGVFTSAEKIYTYWLNLTAFGSSDFMVKVTCVGGSFLSCGTPVISSRQPSPLSGTSVNMTSIKLRSLKAFNKLGASTI